MPKVTGVELIQKLRQVHMELPIILATATSPGIDFARYPALQPNLVLLKPYTHEELLEAVESILQAPNEAGNLNAPPTPSANPTVRREH
jgi:CheY-like chemotaxis protein